MDESTFDNNRVAIRDARQRAEALLTDRYAADVIDGDDLERRLERIHAAQTVRDITEVTRDLADPKANSGSPVSVPATTPTMALARPDQVPVDRDIVSILGEQKQSGPWVPAHLNRVFTVLGSSELDLREATLGPGMTRIAIRCLLGEVVILIPPGLDVRVETNAVLGSVELPERDEPPRCGPSEPYVVLSGFVVLGSVEVYERLPGESKRDAKRRRRRRRKELAQERKRRALVGR